ncbi:MAG: glycoside hydrolase family protein, partial [Coraliomargarita sp.]
WGGKPVLGPDNKYHWFGCRWAEDNPKGHGAWPQSVMVRAVSDRPTGPFIVAEEIAPGHFPEITRLKDGRWALFHFEGYYLADTLFGPWTHVTREEAGFPGIQMGSVCLREDGSLLMVDRRSRIWNKENGAEQFTRMTEHRVIPDHLPGKYEDPVVWRTEVQYHMIVNNFPGRIAHHMRSKDGIHWKTDPGTAYTVGVDSYEDGTKVAWHKYERPKVLQDQYGRATHLYLAVIDVGKKSDKASDNHSSKNIALPLVVERRLQMLNTERITAETSEIRVKAVAEEGFDPHTDMDIESLRFGASEAVDYGRGSSVLRTEPAGKDLILVFDGKGNSIRDNNFAGKLLGKTKEGKLLLGYTRLPEQ